MQIQNIKAGSKNFNISKNKLISCKGAREVVRTLANPDSLSQTLVLETSVTGGRSAQAYKRGGFAEFRERIFDDVVAALFWMKGVDMFNKLGDKFGKHVLKLPTTEFDVGKDALRTPFENLTANVSEDMKRKLAGFKFTKIILSTLLATAFVGFALPKINQAITSKIMGKKRKNIEKQHTINDEIQSANSFETFSKKITKADQTSFKGLSSITTVAHLLENNRLCKMLTTDVGITSGRFATARNKDEGIEYLFRDISSCFFYYASTPLIYKLLQKISGSTKLTTIDPVTAKSVNKIMLEQLKQADGSYAALSVKDFISKTIGVLDDKAKELLKKIPFESDVISLDKLKEVITDEKLISKAKEMAKLQPEQAGVGAVLTRQQVADVLKNGSINTPEFMQEVYKSNFGKALTDPNRFIPMKKITAFRDNIDDYAKAIAESAKDGKVTKELLEKMNKKSFLMSAGFRAAGLIISALALGIAIPKIQCWITAKRTGSNAAPGLRAYEPENKKTEN